MCVLCVRVLLCEGPSSKLDPLAPLRTQPACVLTLCTGNKPSHTMGVGEQAVRSPAKVPHRCESGWGQPCFGAPLSGGRDA